MIKGTSMNPKGLTQSDYTVMTELHAQHLLRLMKRTDSSRDALEGNDEIASMKKNLKRINADQEMRCTIKRRKVAKSTRMKPSFTALPVVGDCTVGRSENTNTTSCRTHTSTNVSTRCFKNEREHRDVAPAFNSNTEQKLEKEPTAADPSSHHNESKPSSRRQSFLRPLFAEIGIRRTSFCSIFSDTETDDVKMQSSSSAHEINTPKKIHTRRRSRRQSLMSLLSDIDFDDGQWDEIEKDYQPGVDACDTMLLKLRSK